MGPRVGHRNEKDMVSNTLSRVAGLAAFALMIARLGRLLDTGTDAPAWNLILIASAFLGGVVWWLLKQTVSSSRLVYGLFVLVGMILFLRIAVPQSLIFGIIPGPETPGALANEISESMDIFRYGVSPVYPSSGLIATLASLMWAIGALFVWGASGGPVAAMTLPSIGLYLQFAVIDRAPAGNGWMGAAAIVFALAMAAIATEQRGNAGRVRDADGRPLPRRGGSVAAVMVVIVAISSVAFASSTSSYLAQDGAITWRTGGGYGEGFGGIAFNRLVGLQKRVISRSNAELFRATLDDSAPPANLIYWRMETLDSYDGTNWLPTNEAPVRYSPNTAGGDPEHAYRGSTATFTQRIRIEALRGPLVPTAGLAQAIQSDTENINQFQVTRDGSVVIQSQLDEGMTYQVEAQYPLEREDINGLATGPDGSLSPLFAEAEKVGAFAVSPAIVDRGEPRPTDIDRYTELPDDLPASIAATAREVTEGARTDFERATLLQYWFRDSGTFEYSTDITPGHTELQLAEWLNDPESVDYRKGYCEQFAASMGVLGRALGIPSRVVWGFTPGEVVTQSDGTQAVVVRDNNAHAWVEMWMDGFGWVRFDPTPRSDSIPESFTASFNPQDFVADPLQQPRTVDQPGFVDDGQVLGFDESDLGVNNGESQSSFPWWILIFPALIVFAALIPILKRVRRYRRLRLIREGDVTAAWDEIVDQLSDLGEPVPANQTPYEFARSTDRTLVPVATAYGAAIYGGKADQGKEDDFLAVENWIRLKFEGGQRMRSRFNPGSLLKSKEDSA
jgi:Transglutaminase-like superfamily/TgpA N-terminal domain